MTAQTALTTNLTRFRDVRCPVCRTYLPANYVSRGPVETFYIHPGRPVLCVVENQPRELVIAS